MSNKPTDDFWDQAGMALIFIAIFGGFALIVWATGGIS